MVLFDAAENGSSVMRLQPIQPPVVDLAGDLFDLGPFRIVVSPKVVDHPAKRPFVGPDSALALCQHVGRVIGQHEIIGLAELGAAGLRKCNANVAAPEEMA